MPFSILVVEVFHMKIHQRLAVSLFAVMMTLSSCNFSASAQKGYDRIKSDIKSSMRVPSSYRGEDVECYWDVQAITYHYQYKITFSGENALGGRDSSTVYYGYSEGNDEVKNYGYDSSYFLTSSGRGEKRSIAA